MEEQHQHDDDAGGIRAALEKAWLDGYLAGRAAAEEEAAAQLQLVAEEMAAQVDQARARSAERLAADRDRRREQWIDRTLRERRQPRRQPKP